jgi:hypothetical protein
MLRATRASGNVHDALCLCYARRSVSSLLTLSQRRRAPWRKIWGRDCKRVGGRAMEQDNQQRAASHNCSLAALGHNPDHFIAVDSLAPDVANTRMPSITSHTFERAIPTCIQPEDLPGNTPSKKGERPALRLRIDSYVSRAH